MIRTGSVSLQPKKRSVNAERLYRTPAADPKSLRHGKTATKCRDNWTETLVSGRRSEAAPCWYKRRTRTITFCKLHSGLSVPPVLDFHLKPELWSTEPQSSSGSDLILTVEMMMTIRWILY